MNSWLLIVCLTTYPHGNCIETGTLERFDTLEECAETLQDLRMAGRCIREAYNTYSVNFAAYASKEEIDKALLKYDSINATATKLDNGMYRLSVKSLPTYNAALKEKVRIEELTGISGIWISKNENNNSR